MRQLVALVVLAGCSGGHECLELDLDCTPLYEPTFEQIYANTLTDSCALSGCHGGASAGGGLGMGDDQATAYDAVLAYVEPDDPTCSHLQDHIEPAGGAKQMPPGSYLDEAELCAIRQWIADGAAP